ncbi:hypothetical protein EGW08_004089, partial [Elysia chlorotica]
ERERQLALARERQARYRLNKKAGSARNSGSSTTATADDYAAPRKSVKTMTPEEYAEHRREVVARCRSKMSSQKKAALRIKDRVYRQNKRSASKPETPRSACAEIPAPECLK